MALVISLSSTPGTESTYDGGDGELLLPRILEQLEDVVADDDARLPAENVRGTHCELLGGRSGG